MRGVIERERSFTQPLAGVIKYILFFIGTLFVLALLAGIWNHSWSLWGFGTGPVCVDRVPLNGLAEQGTSSLAHLHTGATSGTSGVSVCQQTPTTYQRLLVTLTQLPGSLEYLATLGLLLRLLSVATRIGPFDLRVVRRLRFLAWFVLAGSVLAAGVEGLAVNLFVATAVTDPVPLALNVVNVLISAIWTPLLIACGLLTLARIIRVGTRMSDDLAGTV